MRIEQCHSSSWQSTTTVNRDQSWQPPHGTPPPVSLHTVALYITLLKLMHHKLADRALILHDRLEQDGLPARDLRNRAHGGGVP